MSEFLIDFFKSMMSEAGVVAGMLAIGLYYQTKELAKERIETKRLNEQMLVLATGQVKAMNELNTTLKSVIDMLPLKSV